MVQISPLKRTAITERFQNYYLNNFMTMEMMDSLTMDPQGYLSRSHQKERTMVVIAKR